MGLSKGKTNNKNRRPKGIPNKVTAGIREFLTQFLDDRKEQLAKDFDALPPAQRLYMFEKLLRFTLPTLQSATLTTDFAKLTNQELDLILNNLTNANKGRKDKSS